MKNLVRKISISVPAVAVFILGGALSVGTARAITSQIAPTYLAFTTTAPPGDPTAGGIGPPFYDAGLPVNLGNVFTVSTSIRVTGLGFYAQDGLTEPETLGLYNNSGGGLIATTSVSLTDPLVTGYLFHSITPLDIGPGTYTVDAEVNANPWSYGAAPATGPGITFLHNAYFYGDALTYPTNTGGSGPAYYGPNLEYTATPEPGFYGAVALGLGGLLFVSLRRRRA